MCFHIHRSYVTRRIMSAAVSYLYMYVFRDTIPSWQNEYCFSITVKFARIYFVECIERAQLLEFYIMIYLNGYLIMWMVFIITQYC